MDFPSRHLGFSVMHDRILFYEFASVPPAYYMEARCPASTDPKGKISFIPYGHDTLSERGGGKPA